MRRLKLTISYDGGPFYGWQRQEGLPTIQGMLEAVFQDFLRKPIPVWGSGRTDAGVHAEGQIAHVDIFCDYPTFSIQGALNKRLKGIPIVLLNVEDVSPSFHARFSARRRLYTYKILNRRAPPALEKDRVWWVARELCERKMAEASTFLLGCHDFTSFRGTHCQASSPVKTTDVLTVTREGDFIIIKASARSFLHHQVRNFVGTLKKVGDCSWPPEKVKEILDARDRKEAGPTAPPQGLYLTRIEYI